MSTPPAGSGFERSRIGGAPAPSGRPRWLAIVGIVLVPLVVAGILIWALWNPQQRLDTVHAAIVNNDAPVTINGQTVPLGRQLAAGLIDGSGASVVGALSPTGTASPAPSGTPSPAPTSTASPAPTSTASPAPTDGSLNYDWVITDASDAREGLASGRFAAVITIPKNFSAAATSFSGPAADATKATIDVAVSERSTVVDNAISQVIASTAASLTGQQLTTNYLTNVYTSFNTINSSLGQAAAGAASLAAGTSSLNSGAAQLSSGAAQLAAGASSLSSGVSQLADGQAQLAAGLTTLQQQTASLPAQTSQLAAGAQGVANAIDTVNAAIDTKVAALSARIAQLSTDVAAACAPGRLPERCATLEADLTAANAAVNALKGVASLAALSAAADQVAGGATQLADAMPAVTNGISESASAADTLATAGASASSGAATLASSAATLASGAQSVASGAASVDSGAASLDSGLVSAVAQVPTFTESDSDHLSAVVAQPVVVSNTTGLGVGTSSVPFYAVLALWLGALASLLVLRAIPVEALGSTKPSVVLALRAWLPIALVGVVQGILVTVILSTVVDLDLASWFVFAGIAALVGVAFAATNQALVAVFGGAGRFLSMIVALVLIGTSIIATAPAALSVLLGLMPVQPAQDAFRAVVTGGNAVGSVVGLVIWTLLSLVATTLATARSRTVPARKLLPPVSTATEPV